jgi:hypothetical protein
VVNLSAAPVNGMAHALRARGCDCFDPFGGYSARVLVQELLDEFNAL